jgi:tRNA (guanosine-2'-O-)-methyltransferase
MHGFTESLNISVCAAIVLRDLTNQLRASKLDWQLTENDILEKRLDWTKKSIKNVEGIIERFKK